MLDMISKSGNCLVMITSLKTIKKESLNEIDFGYLMIPKLIFLLCGYFFKKIIIPFCCMVQQLYFLPILQ